MTLAPLPDLDDPDAPPLDTLTIDLPDLKATQRLAGLLAPWLSAGDLVALTGDLGAGKTAFARALIRTLAGDPDLEVPSPTFSLMLAYEMPRGRVLHADLYRIEAPDELDEIGWQEQTEDAIVLVEWAERAPDHLPRDHFVVAFSLAPDLAPEGRRALLAGSGLYAERILRLKAAERLLEEAGFSGAQLDYMQGDASARAYARVTSPSRSAVLMNAPARPDGPPIRDGLPYSRIAHLAEDVSAFVALARGLTAQGFSAPDILASDLENGLLIIEDLGPQTVTAGDPPAPVRARYEAAMEVLAALHARALPDRIEIEPGRFHELATYDLDAFLIEAELMLDWYLPYRDISLDSARREEFRALWRAALEPALADPPTWVLRDYHSPNLIWLDDRDGPGKVGLIDFQDAVMGPAAYDVVSLAQDARVDVPQNLEMALVNHYVKRRRMVDPGFDARAFGLLYALMGAQRATKILGIFTRLKLRDGKPHYLRHLPRIRRYLNRCLSHSQMAPLRAWYETVLPSQVREP